jgi:hypothetical protein
VAPSVFLESPAVIEGIGRRRAAALEQAGIHSVAEMLLAGPRATHRALTRVARRQVGDWFATALLLRVSEMTPNLAEALVAGEIRSVRRLSEAGLQTLERAMKRAVDDGKLAEAPSLYRLAEYQRDAAAVRDRGVVVGKVVDRTRQRPVPGVSVWGVRRETETDGRGVFAFTNVPAGPLRLAVDAPGRRTPVPFTVRVEAGRIAAARLRLPPRPRGRPAPREIRESDGKLVWHGRSSLPRLVTRALSDVPDGVHLLLQSVGRAGEGRLVNLYKTRVGNVVLTERVDVAAADLPAGAAAGDVLELAGGRLTRTQLSVMDVAALKVERALGVRPKPRRRIVVRL